MGRFAAGAAALAMMLSVALGTARSGPAMWEVKVGGETPDHAVQAQIFAPETITIAAGDTVTWTNDAVFDHTVSFLSGARPPALGIPQKDGTLLFNPLVAFPQGDKTYGGTGIASSGLMMGRGRQYSLRFTRPGRYVYVCLIHPGMVGMVVVGPAGKKAGSSQAGNARTGAQQVAAALQKGRALLASAKVSVGRGAAGAVYTSPMVGSLGAGASVVRFIPERLTIKAGDTVRWIMNDPIELHAVTFSGPAQPPEFIVAKPRPKGPPALYFNTKVFPRLGGPDHKGSGYYNSGFLTFAPPGAKSYALRFTKPGTYTYWCVVHVPQGMKGTIVVR